MAGNSHIEWTDATWNPVTGCSKVSPGCKHCYAERMAKRLQAMGQPNYANGFEVTLQPHMLELPLEWKRPRRVFVNSMSDLFHKDVPLSFIKKVFSVMRRANWHQYQLLTKRSERLLEVSPLLTWEPHIWIGVSVENDDYTSRIDDLRKTGAERQIPFARAAARTASEAQPSRDRLGDCRWRIGARREADESGLGPRHPRPVHSGQRALLLQTMGWSV